MIIASIFPQIVFSDQCGMGFPLCSGGGKEGLSPCVICVEYTIQLVWCVGQSGLSRLQLQVQLVMNNSLFSLTQGRPFRV